MTFQASARKWRPQKFSELIGQEPIVRTLTNALELNRIAHAYVFSGTRGVGKTTTARLLAKALNCEQGPTTEPCDACTHCIEIRDGRSVDVLEIDGASNNGINEVREIIDNIQYSTSACRFKVYIIDEVHMLSKPAFNALLKTLEEPPERVVFLFATTELNKIPETILSRCQCFEFKPLSQAQIMKQLELICRHDQIEIDEASLEEIARNGAGSMRDAQSLLDQVIAFCGRTIDAGAVEEVLGLVGREGLEAFVDLLLARDGAGLMQAIHRIAQEGKDLQLFCRDLAEYLRHLMIVKIARQPEALLDARGGDLQALRRQAEATHLDTLQQMFQALARAEMDMKRSAIPRMVFEMAVVRLLDVRPFQELDALIDRINQMEPNGPPPAPASGRAAAPPESVPPQANPPAPEAAPKEGEDPWTRIKTRAAETKRVFDQYLAQARLLELNESVLHLALPDPFTHGLMAKDENTQLLQEIVAEVCGFPHVKIKLECRQGGAAPPAPSGKAAPAEASRKASAKKKPAPSEDQILKDALDIFGGTVIG